MDSRSIAEGLGATLPETMLAAMMMVVILADLSRFRRSAGFLALLGLFLAGALVLGSPAGGPAGPKAVFAQSYAVDGFSNFFKLTFLGAAFIVGIFSIPAIRGWASGQGEFFALLLACTLGMMLMASANDLLLMYLSLEFSSVTSYILAGLLRKNRKSSEASLKYIIYGAASSGLMIYGMTFLYGLSGTLNVAEIGRRLSEPGAGVPPTLTLITSVLIMAGFGYKIAAVPFHMWCPDVYEGAPTPVTAFFSVGPKAAGFAMLVRFLINVFPVQSGQTDHAPFEWKLVLALLSVLTMAVGNLAALQQQNLKRLLAYSSIAHAGYLLIAFNAFTPDARAGLLAYIFVYVIMNLGAFLVVIVLEEKYGVETIEGCRGLGWRAPQLGALFTVFMISLTGLPPTAGFTGKFLLFGYVIDYGRDRVLAVALVVAGVLFSVVSLFYYMRPVAAMYLAKTRESEPEEPVSAGPVYTTLLWVLAIGTLGFGLWWGPLQEFAEQSSRSFLGAP
jgi:NADH-quinone oxidoreductase subunit N